MIWAIHALAVMVMKEIFLKLDLSLKICDVHIVSKIRYSLSTSDFGKWKALQGNGKILILAECDDDRFNKVTGNQSQV